VPAATASRAHRLNGRVTLLLAVAVAFTCLAGPAGPLSPVRVLLHSVFGSLVFAVLAAKYAVLKLARQADRYLPWLGGALFLLFGAIWATSVADFVTTR
jgi:hypothetical protein